MPRCWRLAVPSAGAAPPQHHPHPGRRPRLRRPRALRPDEVRDAATRPAGARGHALHAVLRRQHGVRAVARGADDRACTPATTGSAATARFPLRPEDVTLAGGAAGDAGYRTAVVGKWGLGRADTTGRPGPAGLRSLLRLPRPPPRAPAVHDHLWRNGDARRLRRRRATTPTICSPPRRSTFVERRRRRGRSSSTSNYTVPHAELRVPEDSLAQYRGRFPETPFVNADGRRPTRRCRRFASLGYRSQPTPHAAFAAMITRMDRDIGRLMATLSRAGHRQAARWCCSPATTAPHQEGGADPAFFNSTGGLRGIKRDLYEGGIRVPMIARWPGRCRPAATSDARLGALGPAADAGRPGRRDDARRASTASRCARRSRAGRSRRTSSSTGSFTSADSSRRSGWGSGRRCG